MIWAEFRTTDEGKVIYARTDDDGKIRLTAVAGHPELDAYLAWLEAGNDPDEFWTQETI
jgi:hypothetical protein